MLDVPYSTSISVGVEANVETLSCTPPQTLNPVCPDSHQDSLGALVEKQAERTHVYIRVYVSLRIYERKAVCLHFARRPSEGFQTASTWHPAVGLCPGSWGGPRGVGVFLCARYPCTCFSQGARRKDFWRNTGTCPTLSRTRTPFSIAAISGLRWGQRRASLQLIAHV